MERLSIKLANNKTASITLHIRVRDSATHRLARAANHSIPVLRVSPSGTLAEACATTSPAVMCNGSKYAITRVHLENGPGAALAVVIALHVEFVATEGPHLEVNRSALLVNGRSYECTASTALSNDKSEHTVTFTIGDLSHADLVSSDMMLSFGGPGGVELSVHISDCTQPRRPSIGSDSGAWEEAEKLILADATEDDLDLEADDYDLSGDADDSLFIRHFEE